MRRLCFSVRLPFLILFADLLIRSVAGFGFLEPSASVDLSGVPAWNQLSPAVEHKLLHILGLNGRPRGKRSASPHLPIPDYLRKLYSQMAPRDGGITAEPLFDTVRTYHPEANSTKKSQLVFDLRSLRDESREKLVSAELRLMINVTAARNLLCNDPQAAPSSSHQWSNGALFDSADPPSTSTPNSVPVRVNLYQPFQTDRLLLDTQTFWLSGGSSDLSLSPDSVVFDLELSLVRRWLTGSSRLGCLEVEVFVEDGVNLASSTSSVGVTRRTSDWLFHFDNGANASLNAPALLVYTNDVGQRARRAAARDMYERLMRQRRSYPVDDASAVTQTTTSAVPPHRHRRSRSHRRHHSDRSRNSPRVMRKYQRLYDPNHSACRRANLYVNFAEVGWTDWIIAPEGYHAYYCKGSCLWPHTARMNVSNHGILQSLLHSVYESQVPPPCCVPTKLAPISLLYYDEFGKVVLKTYEDMEVESCGCV